MITKEDIDAMKDEEVFPEKEIKSTLEDAIYERITSKFGEATEQNIRKFWNDYFKMS